MKNNNVLAICLLVSMVISIVLFVTLKKNESKIEDLEKERQSSDSTYWETFLSENEVIKDKIYIIDSLKKKNLELQYQNDSLEVMILYIDDALVDNKTKLAKKMKYIDTLNVESMIKYFKDNLYKK
jgi:uncharacterized membrane protein